MESAAMYVAAASVVVTFLVVCGLFYYVIVSIQRRCAMAPGWHFDRDVQPVRFWLQISIALFIALQQLAKLVLALAPLYGSA